MTAQQVKILEQIDEMMSEHFDAYQLSAQINDIDGARPGDGYIHQFNGPMSSVMGLLDMHKSCLIKAYVSDDGE